MLEGKRVFLRHFVETDAPTLLKWGQDEHYHKLAAFEKIADLSEAQTASSQYAKRPYSYALCLKSSKEVIGLVELYERGMDLQGGLLKTKELGFLLDKNFEHHGYMTEGLALIFDDAFGVKGQTEIWAGTFSSNLKAQKFLENLHFKYMYTADYSQIKNLFSYQEKYYLLKREEWLKIKQNTKS